MRAGTDRVGASHLSTSALREKLSQFISSSSVDLKRWLNVVSHPVEYIIESTAIEIKSAALESVVVVKVAR
jgi:hypothetical protein